MIDLDAPVSRAPSTGVHYATRKGQDDLRIYSIITPLGVLARDIAADFSPEEPLEGNRRVNAKRAEEYTDYVIERHGEGRAHITPPVVMRASNGQVVEVGAWITEEAQGIARGALEIDPRSLRTADGQHRIYGARKKLEWYENEIIKQKLVLETAEANGQEAVVVKQAAERLERLREEREALYHLPVTAEIIMVESERVYQQLFADMVNNAKGLGGDLTTWFDQTKVSYRVARSLVEEGGHPLFVDKVHVGVGTEDRLAAESPHWIGVKTVADIAHAVDKGVTGRYSRGEEKKLEDDRAAEKAIYSEAERFVNCLVEAFPLMREIQDGTPEFGGNVRKSRTNMLTSTSMLRALAGAYRLTVGTDAPAIAGDSLEERADGFTKGASTLVDAMVVDPKVGIGQTHPMVKLSPSSFAFGGKSRPTAPTARIGNINALSQALAKHIAEQAAKS